MNDVELVEWGVYEGSEGIYTERYPNIIDAALWLAERHLITEEKEIEEWFYNNSTIIPHSSDEEYPDNFRLLMSIGMPYIKASHEIVEKAREIRLRGDLRMDPNPSFMVSCHAVKCLLEPSKYKTDATDRYLFTKALTSPKGYYPDGIDIIIKRYKEWLKSDLLMDLDDKFIYNTVFGSLK